MSGLEILGGLGSALGMGASAAAPAAAGAAGAGTAAGLGAAGAGTAAGLGTAATGVGAMSTPGIFAAAPAATSLTPEIAAGIAEGSVPMSVLSMPSAAPAGGAGASALVPPPPTVPPITGNSPLGTAAKNTVDVLNATGALRRPSGAGPQVHMSPVMTGRQAALVSRPAVASPVQRYLALLRR